MITATDLVFKNLGLVQYYWDIVCQKAHLSLVKNLLSFYDEKGTTDYLRKSVNKPIKGPKLCILRYVDVKEELLTCAIIAATVDDLVLLSKWK